MAFAEAEYSCTGEIVMSHRTRQIGRQRTDHSHDIAFGSEIKGKGHPEIVESIPSGQEVSMATMVFWVLHFGSRCITLGVLLFAKRYGYNPRGLHQKQRIFPVVNRQDL
jgi:hypothetical protein